MVIMVTHAQAIKFPLKHLHNPEVSQNHSPWLPLLPWELQFPSSKLYTNQCNGYKGRLLTLSTVSVSSAWPNFSSGRASEEWGSVPKNRVVLLHPLQFSLSISIHRSRLQRKKNEVLSIALNKHIDCLTWYWCTSHG